MALTLEDCPSTALLNVVCLGSNPGSVSSAVVKGGQITLSISLTNMTGTTSTPYAVLIYQLESGTWPFGAWTCTKCTAYQKTPLVGFGWPALAPGASRTVTITLTASAAPGSYIWWASLYDQPLSDVEAAANTSGIVPGQGDWKIQTTITQ